MSSHHLKRLAMPRSWPLPRKTSIWVTRPTPGAHSLEHCMPVSLVIRDVLGLAKTSREVRFILHNELAKIDGRVVKDTRRGVGLMDVLSLGEEHYRCVLDHNGRLRYRTISADEAAWKICRIEGKTTIKGGQTQLNLHDGRNIIVDDPSQYNTGDSLKLGLPEQSIVDHIRFGEGTRCYLIGGGHVGSTADVKEYIVKRSSMPNEVQFDSFGTVTRNVFAIGDAKMPLTEVAE
ncbi:30S ribosomal protein S4e [Candidatus Poseidonia alphae]|uniref:30S ribosomal protein S4e n=1 Tax=Candidatus Poseidonia alphae TaxID=1915863 RepID=UPI002328212C|nr:30S ribosomal protein S4e [Candidatus Poseidonia alphae]MDA8638249.1 30S ribosomal protein S4e [Candidatus Poseidonia alphae]MDA8749401.1 30S ribosomal protein S4e [Candidatus Poseidonia alphae]MDA8759506.1 30S ribosomal protein S4e [Candidatus Poseidonia alphae]